MGAIQTYGERYAILSGEALVVDRGATGKPTSYPIGDIRSVDAGSTQARIMEWGQNNCLPNEREQLVAENNIVPALMLTRRNILLGKGLMAYKKKIVDDKEEIQPVEMPPEAKEFFERNRINKYLAKAASNLIFHSAIPTEFIRDKAGRIARIRALECRHVRLGEQDSKGISRELFWKGTWSTKSRRVKNQPAQRIPLYIRDKRQNKFATFEVDDLLCLDEYYPTPYWWGSEEWIRLANKIPQFHDANLDHGYSMRWHIEIPKDYFLDTKALNEVPDGSDESKAILKKASTAKQEFLRKLNEVLQGLKNAGKTIVTEYDIDKALNQQYPGIKITPLNYDMKDEALLKLFDASNAANMSAQGVHPTLANIQTDGKLSSGSEIQNAFVMYIAIHTPNARNLLLYNINLVKRENKWPEDVYYGFSDTLITRLDEDKSGTTETNDNNPSTA